MNYMQPCKVSLKIMGGGDMEYPTVYPNERVALDWIKKQVDLYNETQRKLQTGKVQQERYVHDGIVEVTLTDNFKKFKNTGLWGVYKIKNTEEVPNDKVQGPSQAPLF